MKESKKKLYNLTQYRFVEDLPDPKESNHKIINILSCRFVF